MRRIGTRSQRLFLLGLGLVGSPYGVSGVVQGRFAKPIVIVALGDSYGSGEGNPDNALGEPPIDRTEWESVPCHRSAHAWPQLVADSIRTALAPREVIFKSFACGGATIEEGILGTQPTNQPGVPYGERVKVPVIAQVNQAAQWFAPIKRRHGLDGVDMILLSIGGNDVGFADVIGRCLAPAVNCADVPYTRSIMARGFASLAPNFQRVGAQLQTTLAPSNVFIVGYPDPTRDGSGRFCHRFEDSFDVWNTVTRPSLRSFQRAPLVLGSLTNNISSGETEFIYQNFLMRVNGAMRDAARNNSHFGSWHYVDGMVEQTRNHGYCAPQNQRWFHTLSSSYHSQGDLHGMMHPNRRGHVAYVGVVVPQIMAAMGWQTVVRRPRRGVDFER